MSMALSTGGQTVQRMAIMLRITSVGWQTNWIAATRDGKNNLMITLLNILQRILKIIALNKNLFDSLPA